MKRVATIAVVVGLLFSAPAIAQTPYDGVWNVTVETRAGSCEPSVHYPVTVMAKSQQRARILQVTSGVTDM